MTDLKVTQADIDSAAAYWGNDNPPVELRQAFARHRADSQAELVREIAALTDEFIFASDADVFRLIDGINAALARVRGEKA